ncbi:hypothetical protein TNCV_300341 [Trichonephila clavipes]|nr:hypothetical protein TNCV_300341 [Trichonephila clavipes]
MKNNNNNFAPGVSFLLGYVSAKILKWEETLKLLNILDSEESDIEINALPIVIAVLPDISELTGEEGDDNEVNTSEIIIKDVPESLEVRSGDSFQREPLTSSSVSTIKNRKKAKRHQSLWIKNKSPHYQNG